MSFFFFFFWQAELLKRKAKKATLRDSLDFEGRIMARDWRFDDEKPVRERRVSPVNVHSVESQKSLLVHVEAYWWILVIIIIFNVKTKKRRRREKRWWSIYMECVFVVVVVVVIIITIRHNNKQSSMTVRRRENFFFSFLSLFRMSNRRRCHQNSRDVHCFSDHQINIYLLVFSHEFDTKKYIYLYSHQSLSFFSRVFVHQHRFLLLADMTATTSKVIHKVRNETYLPLVIWGIKRAKERICFRNVKTFDSIEGIKNMIRCKDQQAYLEEITHTLSTWLKKRKHSHETPISFYWLVPKCILLFKLLTRDSFPGIGVRWGIGTVSVAVPIKFTRLVLI